ncbi:stromal membrane-associated protein [Colletotrichum karsti]|uniref:Stromal membrane-associated protein n=1 Tax=Colletotrichum karsti TaxID=1095194 RepID=A0A9P6I9B3_9PEZI|nr:stromal membrane-associated protein [Colletotrichum karsti]KAF9876321.1 stromal membrane-associated protein [Colletotrichum karsti]
MSRRPPNPAAERALQNQATIKSLLKLECNKVCSDCKRNKHPRWASWNLGVFICIRCSGIHRGMGTHISRVKSVDLDSWTDEQLKSILSWGNARANKYWEAKLAPGHVPSESKIENFIRTKYELKRWTMDGPIPDPASLDADGDDDVPLSLVKEKQNVERRESVRKSSVGKSAAPPRSIAAPQPQVDLIGGDPIPRASTAGPQPGKVPPKSDPAPPKATSTKDSLLGLDFFGEPAAPPRPASTNAAGGMGGPSRPDLKQSILSLYASAPKPQPQQQQAPQVPGGQFGGMPSPTYGHQQQQSFGGMTDAFSNLSFNNTTSPKPAAADPFASLASPVSSKSPPPSSNAFGGLGGGSFFDSKPAAPAAAAPQPQTQPSNSGFGGFGWSSSPAPAPAPSQPKPAQSASSGMGDLFDLSSPAPAAAAPSPAPAPAAASSSVFNLSSQPKSPPATNPTAAATSTMSTGNWSNSDVWGSNAWGAPDTSAAAAPAKAPEAPKPTGGFGGSADIGGWGASGSFASTPIVPGASGGFSAAPKVAADEEFGGWTSSTTPAASGSSKPVGGNDDLFSNVWQ